MGVWLKWYSHLENEWKWSQILQVYQEPHRFTIHQRDDVGDMTFDDDITEDFWYFGLVTINGILKDSIVETILHMWVKKDVNSDNTF